MAARATIARAPRRAVWASGVAALAVAALAVVWAFGPGGAIAPEPLSGERARVAALRAEAVFEDAERFWAARFSAEAGRAYAPATLRTFSRRTETRCAGGASASGLFHCAADGVVAADLAFLDGLGRRQRADAERATASFVARAVAGHAQALLGMPPGAETGDCLVGLWAADAAPRIGLVSADVYGQMLVSAQEVLREETGRPADWRDPALFAPGARSTRQAAFARGLEAVRIAGCLGA